MPSDPNRKIKKKISRGDPIFRKYLDLGPKRLMTKLCLIELRAKNFTCWAPVAKMETLNILYESCRKELDEVVCEHEKSIGIMRKNILKLIEEDPSDELVEEEMSYDVLIDRKIRDCKILFEYTYEEACLSAVV